MATVVRDTAPLARTLASAVNAVKAQIGAGSSFHLDAYEAVITAPNATDLPSSLALCIALSAYYEFHRQDALAHKAADGTNKLTTPDPVDLTTAQARANEIKTDYTAHIASTTFHFNADATNTITAANATNQATLNTLLNELKTDMAAHTASAPSAPSIRLVQA